MMRMGMWAMLWMGMAGAQEAAAQTQRAEVTETQHAQVTEAAGAQVTGTESAQVTETAGVELKQLFTAMPDSLCPLLTQVNRADFIDFIESKMKAEVSNRLGGKSQMTELAPTYLRIRLTESTDWQMKLLPTAQGDTLICVVTTVELPTADSHIEFYTTSWRPLSASVYLPKRPETRDFVASADLLKDAYGRPLSALSRADMHLVRWTLAPDNNDLTALLTTPDYMEKEQAEKLRPHLKGALRYRWSGTAFLPEGE